MENKTLKILHVLPSLGRGGAERLVLDFVSTSQRLFPELRFCVVSLSEKDEYSADYPTVHIEKIPSTCPISITGRSKPDLTAFHEFVDSFQPNIIHSHVFFADLVCHYRILKNVKYVSHIHGRTKQFEPFPVHGWLSKESYTNEIERRFIIKQFKKANTSFIAITKFQEQEFIKTHQSRSFRIEVINNAIDNFKFHPKKENLFSSKIELITVGRMDENKNHLFTLEVIKHLVSKKIDIHLTIIGDGELKKTLNERILDLQMSEYISLLGKKNHPEHYLRRANIYIHSAKQEAFGLTLIEAIACGTPVIFTDGKGNTELFKDAGVGTIIYDNDPETMANAIIALFNDLKRYKEEQLKGIAFAQSFGIEEFSKKLVDYYFRLFE